MTKEKVLAATVVLYTVVQLCSAVEFQCTVTQDGPLTTYSISPEFAGFTSDPSSFDYSWSNGSDTVLANQDRHIDPVTNCTLITFATSECIPIVHYTATCSKGKIETEYTSTCSTNCSDNALSQVTGTDPWNALRVVIPVLILILVLAGLCFLCYKFRDRIRKMCCCGQVGGYYRSVKMEKTGAQVVEV